MFASTTTTKQSRRLMKPLSSVLRLKPKATWPDPESSAGESFGVLGKYQCWEAIGPAGNIPQSTAFRNIRPLLESRYEYLHEGLSVPRALSYELYMIGKVKQEAQPHIIFICESKLSRERALELVSESGILEAYPGLLLGECSRAPILSQPAIPLALLAPVLDVSICGESKGGPVLESAQNVYYLDPLLNAYGFRIFVEVLGGGPRREATAGGIIRIGDRLFVLTVVHTFFDSPSREKADVSTPMEFSLALDDDSDDEDIEGNEFISQRSEALEPLPSSNLGLVHNVHSASSLLRHESRSESSTWASQSFDFNQSSPDTTRHENSLYLLGSLSNERELHTGIGLDWALVPLYRGVSLRSVSLLKRAPNIREVARKISSRIEVNAITACNGNLSGTLFKNPTIMQVPPSATFQELWVVHLEGPLQRGDCGAWIVDKNYEILYGYITLGDPGCSIAYIVPAYQAFADIEQKLGYKVDFLHQDDFTVVSILGRDTRNRLQNVKTDIRNNNFRARPTTTSTLSNLYSGIDVVYIPGLSNFASQSRSEDDHELWLRDVLSYQIPQARVLIFDHNFAESPVDVSWGNLKDQGHRLLCMLLKERKDFKNDSRPIVFICYSFGAFILKKALLIASCEPGYRHIFNNTIGVLFLSCIHNEQRPDFKDTVLHCAAAESGQTTRKSPLVKALKKLDWDPLKEIMRNFRDLNPNFRVRSFYERKETVWQHKRWRYPKAHCLITEEMANLDWKSEKVIATEANHLEMAQFPSRHEIYFHVLIRYLNELAIDKRYLASDVAAVQKITPEFHRSTRIPCFVTTPHLKNEQFVGRNDVMKKIDVALRLPSHNEAPSQRTFAICGPGGFGKTQSALNYVFSHRKHFSIILWANAESYAKLATSFSNFSVELGLRDKKPENPHSVAQYMKEWLEKTKDNWLLVFDNAASDENEDSLQQKEDLVKIFRPECNHGSILITSRDEKLISKFGGVELRQLNEEDAVELLITRTKLGQANFNQSSIDEEIIAARKIVESTDYHPLGIIGISDIIRRDSARLTDFYKSHTNHHSVHTVWKRQFEKLNKDALKFLNLMAYLDQDQIQIKMLRQFFGISRKKELEMISTPRKLDLLKSILIQSSLVSYNEDLQQLRVNRQVQGYCRSRMTPQDRCKNFGLGVAIIKQSWPSQTRGIMYDPALLPGRMDYLSHVESLCRHYTRSLAGPDPALIPEDKVNWEFPSILYEAGWMCYEKGLFDLTQDLLGRAEEYCLKHISKGKGGLVALADIYGGLGSLDTETNNFEGALKNFQNQWSYIQEAFKEGELQRPNSWEGLSLGRIGNGLQGMNRFEEAEDYYRRCLKAWEGLEGDRKLFTAMLATCLWLQGKLHEAEETVMPLITDRNDRTDFSFVLRTGLAMFALGNIQTAQGEEFEKCQDIVAARGKYEEAYQTHLQALQIYRATLGERHHKTADAFYKMGCHLHRKRSYFEATNMLESALKRYEDHDYLQNEIARVKYKMGCVHQDMGLLSKGREEIDAAKRIRRRILSVYTPVTDEKSFDCLVQFWSR
ncbi:hypothetical protein BP6252_05030 [Coleophoma cylindrospora]|uniref:Uncharacterized protein n=1 Tax=Coleophoma cylindrospora TaxID=1849047 RepID=A0A3D8RSC3_9HELO|nr:hypothetical protein BP6252_05030 [Coleophoma cylindrospora]